MKSSTSATQKPVQRLHSDSDIDPSTFKDKKALQTSVLTNGKAAKPEPNSSSHIDLVNEEFTYIPHCFISFFESTQEFYVQQSNFDEEIAKIQPIIESCLDPYDSKDSALCVGQFKSDNQFYRCRVLDSNETSDEVKCVFIDFGNKDMVSLDTITEMSASLKKFKPLAVQCKLSEAFALDSFEHQQLTDLILNDVPFDIKVKKEDLMRFYSTENYDFGPVMIEMRASETNTKINAENLNKKSLWTSMLKSVEK